MAKDTWEKFDIISKFLGSVILVIIAFLIKSGTEQVTQSNEKSKIVNTLISDLSDDKKVRQDIALIALDNYLSKKDDSLICLIAERIILNDKKEKWDSSSLLISERRVAFNIIKKRDITRANNLVNALASSRERLPVTAPSNGDTARPVKISVSKEANLLAELSNKIVYIQWHGKKEAAEKIRAICNSRGWTSPVSESINYDFSSDIRFFHKEDSVFAVRVKHLADSITKSDIQLIHVKYYTKAVPPGQIEVWIGTKKLVKLNIPASFSPNGDGIADVWKIPTIEEYQIAALDIFDRFGQKIFSSPHYKNNWDGTSEGKPLPAGVYTYTLFTGLGLDGPHVKKGTVTITRGPGLKINLLNGK